MHVIQMCETSIAVKREDLVTQGRNQTLVATNASSLTSKTRMKAAAKLLRHKESKTLSLRMIGKF